MQFNGKERTPPNVTYGTTVKITSPNISVFLKAKFILDAHVIQGRYLHVKTTMNRQKSLRFHSQNS